MPARPLAFPSADLVQGGAMSLDADALPSAETPVRVERLAWREGFSTVQTTVFDLGPEVDASVLPGQAELSTGGAVRILDLRSGEDLPCFAELDAWPDNPEDPSLLVRPMVPLTVGTEVAVVVTTQVAPVTEFWEAGGDAELHSRLWELGVEDVAMATSFPVSDGTRPLTSALEQVETPSAYAWEYVNEDAANMPEGIWRRLEGTYTTANFLDEDGQLSLQDGAAAQLGELEADLYVYFPESVRDAEPGTVPVWMFGHGIFSHPDNYFYEEGDPNGVIELANEAGVIVIATVWRGMTTRDLVVPITAGNDFARINEVTDHLVQGVANNVALGKLIQDGELLGDEELLGLADRRQVFWYGISLGAIEGAVLLANQSVIEHGVLHVGGGAWSTMLERSSNWTQFEMLMEDSVPSPRDRQVLYALSQLYWDPVDPLSYTSRLSQRSLLWQESIGDEQVPNLTTRLLARAVGAEVLKPAAEVPAGLISSTSPLVPAMSQFDPEKPLPTQENRPAESTGAHSDPRTWPGQHAQTARFLDPDDPGVIEHFCGEQVCSASNDGG